MQQMVLALLLLPAVFYFGLLARALHRYTFCVQHSFFAMEIIFSIYFLFFSFFMGGGASLGINCLITILKSGHYWPTSQEGLILRNSGDRDRVLGNELTSNLGDKNHLMLSGFCQPHQPHKVFKLVRCLLMTQYLQEPGQSWGRART